MIASSFLPMFSLLAQLSRQPDAPLRLWFRTTSHKLRPPQPRPHAPTTRARQDAVLAAGVAGPHQCAAILTEASPGPQPTIILGGFVPDATEAVYLLRGDLLRRGSLYYFNYPRRGFSLDLVLAQLSDLVAEITLVHRRPPVLLAISFGAGLALEWLRRQPREPALAGLVLVSPVTGVGDLLDPAAAKPTTLLGRVIKPYLDARADLDGALVERSRNVFLKMFEAGAQNKESTRLLLTAGELEHLRSAVQGTIRRVSPTGAWERIQALRAMTTPDAGSPSAAPLTADPVLILYAEKESAVLTENSPTRLALESAHRSWLPESKVWLIANRGGPPVQHASLVFHYGNFLPLIATFYRRLRNGKTRAAA